MSAIAIYEKQETIPFLDRMRTPIASMVACTPDQADTVMLTCMLEGLTPMDFMRKYHMVQGKPTMKADAMLATFRLQYGGKHKVVARTPERAAIVLEDKDGETFEAELTLEELNQSRWPWVDWKADKKVYKDNYATPLDRKTMLWARLVSDSIRAFCPEINNGIYTPEEIEDVTDRPAKNPSTPAKTAMELAQEAAALPANATEFDPVKLEAEAKPVEDVEDADFEVTTGPPEEKATPAPAAPVTQAEGPSISQRTMQRILDAWALLGVSDEDQRKQLAKRGAAMVAELKEPDAVDLADRLEAMRDAKAKN